MKKLILEDLKKKKLSNESLKKVYGGCLGTDLPDQQRLLVSGQKAK